MRTTGTSVSHMGQKPAAPVFIITCFDCGNTFRQPTMLHYGIGSPRDWIISTFATNRCLSLAFGRASETHLAIDPRQVASPLAVIFVEQTLCGDLARCDDLVERVEKALLAVACAVEACARFEARVGDFQNLFRQAVQRPAPGCGRIER